VSAPPAALRRADWRFLLPAPPAGSFEHLVLLGGPAGLAERLRDAGVARTISGRLPSGRGADAVVVLHDAAVAPAAAAAYVAVGGVFYCEVDRRRPATLHRTPARMRRALQAAGLSVVGAYWTVPDFERTRRYLPLDGSEVLEWYFSTLQTAGSPAAVLADALVRRIVSREWGRLASWVPCFGVVAVNGDARDTTPSVLAHPETPAAARPPGGHTAVLTSGQDDGSRVVLLPFALGRAEPTLVVKTTRAPAFNVNTEREQLTLRGLRARLDAALRDSIPEPLGTYPHGDLIVAMESCAPGPALVVSSGRWGAPRARAVDDLRLAADWLARFHEQARCGTGRWDTGLAVPVEGRLEEYERMFAGVAGDGGEARLLSLALDRSRALGAITVPSVPLHNDFAPWNVHRSGRRLTVIDWELGGERERTRVGPPLCDLLYFTTYWYQRARRLRGDTAGLRGVRELFLDGCGIRDGDGIRPMADEARAVVRDYMSRLALDARLRPLLLVYTWVDRALDRAARGALAERGGGSPPNRYREYVRLLATRAEELFAVPRMS
jgi:hypothetical protein